MSELFLKSKDGITITIYSILHQTLMLDTLINMYIINTFRAPQLQT